MRPLLIYYIRIKQSINPLKTILKWNKPTPRILPLRPSPTCPKLQQFYCVTAMKHVQPICNASRNAASVVNARYALTVRCHVNLTRIAWQVVGAIVAVEECVAASKYASEARKSMIIATSPKSARRAFIASLKLRRQTKMRHHRKNPHRFRTPAKKNTIYSVQNKTKWSSFTASLSS